MEPVPQTCPICKGVGYVLVKHPGILHLGIVGKESCDLCGGSGFMSVGYCRDCERKGPWSILKDGCIYCGGKDTIIIDDLF